MTVHTIYTFQKVRQVFQGSMFMHNRAVIHLKLQQ